MDVIVFFAAVFFWIAPLLIFPLSNRCPPRQVEWWLGVLVVSSWVGLALYVWIHYWLPERALGRPCDRRAVSH